MRKDSPLANQETIAPEDLWDKPLILSRQVVDNNSLEPWLKKNISELNIVATYNLVYNASLLVDEGLGYSLTLDKLINTSGNSNLTFIPLNPAGEIDLKIVWKKYQVFSKAAEKFLTEIKKIK
ncbi:MAG: LysR family transcriptional regulator substrate-binding protein [Methanobacterium sp.]|nr:LysR family transcriptional regulator substrate-binding protein [Methanobacterium sp.]